MIVRQQDRKKASYIDRYIFLLNIVQFMMVEQKQGQKRPLDTPKRMIERREREGKREKERQKERYREGGRDKREREREREVKGIER